jgi:SAM-dependent methyltransferase
MATRLDHMMSAAAAYNKVAEQYDMSFHSNVALAEDDVIYDMLRSWLTPGWTIDLGCGTGAFLDHINMGKTDYWGVDLAEKMIEIARAKFQGYQFGTVPMESALALVKPGSVSTPNQNLLHTRITGQRQCTANQQPHTQSTRSRKQLPQPTNHNGLHHQIT